MVNHILEYYYHLTFPSIKKNRKTTLYLRFFSGVTLSSIMSWEYWVEFLVYNIEIYSSYDILSENTHFSVSEFFFHSQNQISLKKTML